jgi:serine/threonine protein kinase
MDGLSLGIVLYEIVTGQVPFKADSTLGLLKAGPRRTDLLMSNLDAARQMLSPDGKGLGGAVQDTRARTRRNSP